MKKQLILGIMSVGIALTLLGSGTFSYFSDTETSIGNTFTAGDLDLLLGEPGLCELAVSFLHEDSFIGVDGDTSGWSQDLTVVQIGHHWDLLSGTADVYAFKNGDAGTLTQRGLRGLGVLGGDGDEIDTIEGDESIVVEFDEPQYLCGFEVRSLFTGEGPGGAPEEGDLELKLDDSTVGYYHFVAVQPDGNGVLHVDVDPEILVDKIVFYVDTNEPYNAWSEFAVARIYLKCVECYQDVEFFNQFGAIWTIDDMKPGYETDGIIYFCEQGTNRGGTLDITCTYFADEDDDGDSTNGLTPGPESDTNPNTGTTQGANAFASYMEIVEMEYYSDSGGPQNLLPSLPDGTNANGWADLQDLSEYSDLTATLGANGAIGDHFYMKIKFNENAGNDFQGDIFTLSMVFTLWQIGVP